MSAAGRIAIRAGGPADLAALRPLWLELHHHHAEVGPQSGTFTDDETSWSVRSASYREWLGEGRGSFLLIAEDPDGTPVGYALVRILESAADLRDSWVVDDLVAELETLVVAAAARGAGLGSRLMDAVDAELERLSIRELMVGVVPGNDAAQALYERRGFQPRWLLLQRPARG